MIRCKTLFSVYWIRLSYKKPFWCKELFEMFTEFLTSGATYTPIKQTACITVKWCQDWSPRPGDMCTFCLMLACLNLAWELRAQLRWPFLSCRLIALFLMNWMNEFSCCFDSVKPWRFLSFLFVCLFVRPSSRPSVNLPLFFSHTLIKVAIRHCAPLVNLELTPFT